MSKLLRLTSMAVPCCRHYRNIFHAASTIVKNEGVLSLQKGLGPALVSDRAFTKNMPFTKQESYSARLLMSVCCIRLPTPCGRYTSSS